MSKPVTRLAVTLVIFSLLLAIGITVYYAWPTQRHQAILAPPKPIPVLIEYVKQVDWDDEVITTGAVESRHAITVEASTSGRVTAVHIKPSQFVVVGEPLYQIGPESLQEKLEHARAMLALAELQFNGEAPLYKLGFVSASAYDVASNTVQMAKAGVMQLEKKLQLTEVTAPFSGYVGLPIVHLGDYVSQGDQLIQLQNDQLFQIDFTVPSTLAKNLKIGNDVYVGFDAYPEKQYSAKIFAITAATNKSSPMLEVHAELIDPPKRLVSGAFATVQVMLNRKRQVIVVPQAAIVYESSDAYVYRVINNRAVKTKVFLGQRHGNLVAVLKGLVPNDKIVVENKVKVVDGSVVKQSRVNL